MIWFLVGLALGLVAGAAIFCYGCVLRVQQGYDLRWVGGGVRWVEREPNTWRYRVEAE